MGLIDGISVAEKVHEETRIKITALSSYGIRPGLAVILVGNQPTSRVYVRRKTEQCTRLGLYSLRLELPDTITQQELLTRIATLNDDPKIHGILVQSPTPPHLNEIEIARAIDPRKDVDGFHPINVAKLVLGDPSGLVPCTPLGCRRLLLEYQVPTSSAHAVILGRSRIVGKPMSLLLMSKGIGGNATVTVVHSLTRNLERITRQADILISAIGRPHFLDGRHVCEGAVVIDVGINRVECPGTPRHRLVGDVHFKQVAPKCSLITPSPGGVGPMTIAMLLSNTVKACRQIHGLSL
ncbi:MAG: bifunctional 5,10-methylenetetrahydrofolate dehydrogenase/5,10-methenyltetrahydrofolate cyclohydrolase [Candidatus Xiphinematobacter sp.]|nr:MAG: bifunctional 5,10-methylenetetrahydrofolate dehydrogenase/5,10-methenyltetrahydrofolate cyclohydrolase [Candidatus Xiphinematobacter sp.]QQY11431.1 MAG: bifunctional 5,10-methylenetetrahydrofolate dehydrogenase/5,10-methenyltetrahydrofolate cyclohydrolase [Candidatus Xiphinematobacter sp.]